MHPSQKREAPTASNVQDERRTVNPGHAYPLNRKTETGARVGFSYPTRAKRGKQQRRRREQQEARALEAAAHAIAFSSLCCPPPSPPCLVRPALPGLLHHRPFPPSCCASHSHHSRRVPFCDFLGGAHSQGTRTPHPLSRGAPQAAHRAQDRAQPAPRCAGHRRCCLAPRQDVRSSRSRLCYSRAAPARTTHHATATYRSISRAAWFIYLSITHATPLPLRQRSAACSRGSAAPSEQQQQW